MNRRENYYLDAIAGRYERVFPVARYADVVDLGDAESVRASLSGNLWFRSSDDARRRSMIDKVVRLEPVVDELCATVRFVEPYLEVEHISIGGSYLYCDGDVAVNDIDFNVIVGGSHFDYYDVYDIDFLRDSLANPIRKISFTVFGASNVFQGTPINDLVVRDSYVHTDVTIREGLVFGWRNATLLGPAFSARAPYLPNLLVRIDRQLYQARLLEEGRIAPDRGEKVRQAKATNRVAEAALLLAEAFPHISLPRQEFLAHNEKNGLDRPLLRHLRQKVGEYRMRV
jgi:hypothetical protein